jgi:uncharacterized protein (TIGR02466 family)
LAADVDGLMIATERRPMLEVESSYGHDSLHTRPEFANLVSAILEHCAIYGEQLGYGARQLQRLKIESMWLNRSDAGDYLFPHAHDASNFSGAFYIRTVAENQIQFHNYNSSLLLPDAPTNYSYTFYSVNCVPNQLLIFTGDLVHSTPQQKSPGEKVVVSFNILFDN